MMYEVILSRQAKHYYAEVPQPVAQRLARLFLSLENDRMPHGAKRLHGKLAGLWRIRVGDLRVVFEVGQTEIRVIRIGPRGDVYL